MKVSILKSLALLVTALASHASATLLSQDDPLFGAGAITFDTASGLGWLDLTKSNNLSFDYVTSQLGIGGEFHGFRYATNSEISSLWVGAGIVVSEVVDGHLYPNPANVAPIEALQTLIGITTPSLGQDTTQGLSGTIFPGPYPHLLPYLSANGVTAPLLCCEQNLGGWSGSEHTEGVGSWLVYGAPPTQSTVTEPSSLALLGVGLFLFRFGRRKSVRSKISA